MIARLSAWTIGLLMTSIVLAQVIAPSGPGRVDSPAPALADQPHIDVVFCIDCSGSMGGVIEAAKQKVWAIVSQVAKAKPAPVLRIGLIGYGNADRTWRIFKLTDDLDEVYKNLMTFKDEGWGDEYVGLAVHKATTEMPWADGKQVLKLIYVVGNETARQGPAEFDYTKTAPAAIKREIIVNAIYCGEQGGQETWQEMARLADGQYAQIEAKGGVVAVQTPFDKELLDLNTRLNGTYLGYGVAGREGAENQAAQDAAAGSVSTPAAADRVAAKSSAQYYNGRWDLVDASKNKDFKLDEVKTEQLPAEMQKMTVEERKAHIAKLTAQREEVRKQIQDTAAKRDAFVKEELAKQGTTGDKALDKAVTESLKQQAEKKNFKFE